MGGVYFGWKLFTLQVLLPLPAVVLGCYVLGKKREHWMKTVSKIYCAIVPVVALVLVIGIIVRGRHPSYFYLTVWCIYYYVILNFTPSILLGGAYLKAAKTSISNKSE
mmetsp:Transcript_25714/g.39540  ORF Transcript_25714/g.39540 Transcript_25714/m.39540 type:complete len:108 (-) Transcript_25714:4-327(-)